MTCTTHHNACDCREEAFRKMEADLQTARALALKYHEALDKIDRVCRVNPSGARHLAQVLAREAIRERPGWVG